MYVLFVDPVGVSDDKCYLSETSREHLLSSLYVDYSRLKYWCIVNGVDLIETAKLSKTIFTIFIGVRRKNSFISG